MTQSAMIAARAARACAWRHCLTVLAGGCGMSSHHLRASARSMFGGSSSEPRRLRPASTRSSCSSAAKTDEQAPRARRSARSAGCPRFSVWPRDNHLTIYEPGRAGDGLAIMHRGEITKTARECQIEPGRVTVQLRLLGPRAARARGQRRQRRLPVNVVVTDAKREKIATDTVKVERRRRRKSDRLFLGRAHGDLRRAGRDAAGRVRGVRRLRPERQGRRLTLSAAAPKAQPKLTFRKLSLSARAGRLLVQLALEIANARIDEGIRRRAGRARFQDLSAAAMALRRRRRAPRSGPAPRRGRSSPRPYLRAPLDRLGQALARLGGERLGFALGLLEIALVSFSASRLLRL